MRGYFVTLALLGMLVSGVNVTSSESADNARELCNKLDLADPSDLWDYGDAPDPSRDVSLKTGYAAEPVLGARFPTVAGTLHTTSQVGARHHVVSVAWLGSGVGTGNAPTETREADADAQPDEDTLLLQPNGNMRGGELNDFTFNPFSMVRTTTRDVSITVGSRVPVERWYLNVVVDWDLDGSWGGASRGTEWVVQNLEVTTENSALPGGPISTPVTFPVTAGSQPGRPWIRVTLTPDAVIMPPDEADRGWDGGVPKGQATASGLVGFPCGETSDGRLITVV